MSRRKPRFLAFAHVKGGSGSTSCATNLAAGLARARRRVLLLDLDPTGAATFALVDRVPELSIVDVLDHRAALRDAICKTAVDGLLVVPAIAALEAWDRRPERFAAELRARVLDDLPPDLDYVLVDLPPTTGPIVRAVLANAPGCGILAAVQTRALDLLGFGEVLRLLEDMKDGDRAPGLHLAGIIPTRTNKTALSRDVLDALRRQHGRLVLPAIPESASVARAPMLRRPVSLTAPRSPGAEAFAALTRAVLRMESAQ